MIQLACMTLPYMHVSFERALEGISRAGYRYIAFGLPHAGTDVPDGDDAATILGLQRLFDRYGAEPVMLIGTDRLKPGMPLELARRRLETAHALGVKEVISLGTWSYRAFPDDAKPEDEMRAEHERFVKQFREVGLIAESLGLTVTLKPHTGNTATARRLRQTLDEIGSGAVLASYDPGNVHYYEGIDAAADFLHIAASTCSIVAKDHRGPRSHHDFPIPGDGDVDFQAIFNTWRKAGRAGPVVVERVDGTAAVPLEPEQIDERIAKARIHLQRLLTQAGF